MAELLTEPEIRSALTSYLRGAVRMPFAFGRADCALFVADWMVRLTGRDGADHLRGCYASAADAARLHGPLGLTRTVDRCARGIGLVRTRKPTMGDIAVIVAAGEVYCAIRSASGWVVRGNRSITRLSDARVVAAWGVGGGSHG